jgi:3-methyladenine DNA glycosylase/8-oxoguanine DNA glycosylase
MPISSVNLRCSWRGLIRAPREAARRAAAWSPYRSYAASYLWRLANLPEA